jgi:cell division control protein 24
MFITRPVSRLCRYQLLFRQLLRVYPLDHEFYDELVEGVAACNRIVKKCNEARRRAHNAEMVEMLEQRVEDWKGHNLANFGQLLLDDVFVVKRSNTDREYRVFLFEKIIIFCKDVLTFPNGYPKGGKNDALWRRRKAQMVPNVLTTSSSKKVAPLLLKGRIHLNSVTKTVCNTTFKGDCSNSPCQFYNVGTHEGISKKFRRSVCSPNLLARG